MGHRLMFNTKGVIYCPRPMPLISLRAHWLFETIVAYKVTVGLTFDSYDLRNIRRHLPGTAQGQFF